MGPTSLAGDLQQWYNFFDHNLAYINTFWFGWCQSFVSELIKEAQWPNG